MLYAALFATFSLVCTVLAFTRHPIYGVYFYLATTFVFPPGRWWGYLFHDLRWALLSAAVTVLAVLFHRGKLAPKPTWLANPPAVLFLLFAILMWLQTPWALDQELHLDGSSRYVKYLFAFWFIYRVVDSKEHLRGLLFAHVLGCALLGVFAQMTGRDGSRLDGVGGPGIDDANTLGMYLVTGAVIAVGLFLTQKGWRRYLLLACMLIIVNGFILANSRGSFLGLLAGMVVVAICVARRYRRMFWGFAVVGAVGLAVLVDDTFINRMFTIQDVTSHDEDADMSARSRLEVAKAQLQMFLDHPMGVGHRGTAVLSTSYLDRKWLTGDEEDAARSSHNAFLSALVEQGFIGAVLFTLMGLWAIVAVFRVRRLNGPNDDPELTTLGASLCGALAVIFVAGNTADYLLAENQFWFYAALVSVFWLNAANRDNLPAGAGAAAVPRPAAVVRLT